MRKEIYVPKDEEPVLEAFEKLGAKEDLSPVVVRLLKEWVQSQQIREARMEEFAIQQGQWLKDGTVELWRLVKFIGERLAHKDYGKRGKYTLYRTRGGAIVVEAWLYDRVGEGQPDWSDECEHIVSARPYTDMDEVPVMDEDGNIIDGVMFQGPSVFEEVWEAAKAALGEPVAVWID